MIQIPTYTTASAIRKKIDEITHALLQELDTVPASGLFGGKAGISLYFSYVSRYKQNNDLDTVINQLITDSFHDINNSISSAAFSFGISGILWNIHHLKTQQFIDTDDYFEDIIPYLGEQMLVYARHQNVDFLHGSLGIAFYLLHFQSIEIESYLSQFMQLLEQQGMEDAQSIKWASSMNKENKKTFNLSLSHGLASIIIFLSKHYHQKRGRPERTRELLKKSLHYLLSQKNNTEKFHSLYPASGELQDEDKNTRLSWCYGDLGTAVAFWQAGNALDEKRWKEEALAILQHASRRRDLKINQVTDAGLCHGTAGIAHIFNRFYRETRHPFLKEAADYWITETLKMATWTEEPGGYKSWQGEEGWVAQYGILEGIAGIGLALISHISTDDPAWDQAFLLN